MGKYDSLGQFLKVQNKSAIPMTFEEIEGILQSRLPPSKKQRAWWSNNPDNNVMTRQWLMAGYQTEQVDVERGRLVFRKLNEVTQEEPVLSSSSHDGGTGEPNRVPKGFGRMKGTMTLDPGWDFAQPAEPDWSQIYNAS